MDPMHIPTLNSLGMAPTVPTIPNMPAMNTGLLNNGQMQGMPQMGTMPLNFPLGLPTLTPLIPLPQPTNAATTTAEQAPHPAKVVKPPSQISWVGAPSKVYYDGFVKDGVEYKVGDCVYLVPTPDSKFIVIITAVFETKDHEKMLTGKWFFKPSDTVRGAPSKSALPKEVFASEETSTNLIDTIEGKCTVKFHEEIENLEEYTKQDHHYFYRKWYDHEKGKWYIHDPDAKDKKKKGKKKGSDEESDEYSDLEVEMSMKKGPGSPSGEPSKRTRKARASVTGSPTLSSKPKKAPPPSLKPANIEWVGPVIKTEGNEKFYGAFKKDNEMYKLGDTVYLRPSFSESPNYVATISSLFEDEVGDMMMGGYWFYRFDELPVLVSEKLVRDSRELYASVDGDYNPIESVIGKCTVRHASEFAGVPNGIPDYLKEDDDNLFYRWWYNSRKKVLQETRPEETIEEVGPDAEAGKEKENKEKQPTTQQKRERKPRKKKADDKDDGTTPKRKRGRPRKNPDAPPKADHPAPTPTPTPVPSGVLPSLAAAMLPSFAPGVLPPLASLPSFLASMNAFTALAANPLTSLPPPITLSQQLPTALQQHLPTPSAPTPPPTVPQPTPPPTIHSIPTTLDEAPTTTPSEVPSQPSQNGGDGMRIDNMVEQPNL